MRQRSRLYRCQECYNGDGLTLLFCSHWFSLPLLNDAYSAARSSKYLADISRYDFRARPWMTATMLVKTIGTFPTDSDDKPIMGHRKINDPDDPFRKRHVLGAAQAKYLSKYIQDQAQLIKTLSNADDWAWYALATYVQGRTGEYPQRPLVPKELPPSPLDLLFGLKEKGDLEEDENMLHNLTTKYDFN